MLKQTQDLQGIFFDKIIQTIRACHTNRRNPSDLVKFWGANTDSKSRNEVWQGQLRFDTLMV